VEASAFEEFAAERAEAAAASAVAARASAFERAAEAEATAEAAFVVEDEGGVRRAMGGVVVVEEEESAASFEIAWTICATRLLLGVFCFISDAPGRKARGGLESGRKDRGERE